MHSCLHSVLHSYSVKLAILTLILGISISGTAQTFSVTGARQNAMGGTSLTVNDVFSAANNQAGLAFIEDMQAGIFTERKFLLSGLNHFTGVFALPTSSGTFGLTIDYFGYSKFNEKKAGIAYGRKVGENFSAGIQLDYVQLSIPEYGNKNIFTFEVGMQYKIMEELMVGAHIFNPLRWTTTEFTDEKYPTLLSLGIAYNPSEKVLLILETEKDIDNPLRFRTGLEYKLVEKLHLRGGYSTYPSMYSFGIGINLNALKIDVASTVHPVLGFSPQLGIIYQIND